MITSKRKEHIDKVNEKRKQRTLDLIRQAGQYLDDIGESKTVPNVSKATKRFDPLGKGISEASFRNKKLKHIQDLMKEYRIGPYLSMLNYSDEASVDVFELIKISKENKKLNKKLEDKIVTIKKLNKELKIYKTSNEVLRHKIMELETKLLTNISFPRSNNMFI